MDPLTIPEVAIKNNSQQFKQKFSLVLILNNKVNPDNKKTTENLVINKTVNSMNTKDHENANLLQWIMKYEN